MEPGGDDALRWTVVGTRPVYDDQQVRVDLAEVHPPGRDRGERRVVRLNRVAVGMVLDEQERVLMTWRHRFISDAFGWEVPAAQVEPEEHAAASAVRAVEEDTGWRPASPMWHLLTFQPVAGTVDAPHEVYLAEGAEPFPGAARGHPHQPVQWISLAAVPSLIERAQITDAASLVGLLYLTALRAKRA